MKKKKTQLANTNDALSKQSDFDFFKLLLVTSNKNYLEFYNYSDLQYISNLIADSSLSSRIYDLDRLLEKDKLREKDGFARKIKLGRLVKPSKEGADKTIIIPTTTEEKFLHWNSEAASEGESTTGGSGEEAEGEVIGEESLRPDEDGDGQGGQGKGGEHGMGADAYDVGRILTEQFELPNLKEKGKKTSLTKFTYDLNDKNLGHGQIVDKKATLKRIVRTNLSLGRIKTEGDIDTTDMLINPKDSVYRILTKEKDYESQAVVFFVRDYSGSMQGKPTEAVITQHIYINSWLVYQYKRHVKSRFILHDNEAIEVPDFYTYYNKQVAGGTEVTAGYELVNKIVEEENLTKDYNIYIFHGTDGDDWSTDGKTAIEELKKMLKYASRIGITVAENNSSSRNNSVVERYIRASKLLEEEKIKLHFDSFIASEADESRIIQSIKTLIS